MGLLSACFGFLFPSEILRYKFNPSRSSQKSNIIIDSCMIQRILLTQIVRSVWHGPSFLISFLFFVMMWKFHNNQMLHRKYTYSPLYNLIIQSHHHVHTTVSSFHLTKHHTYIFFNELHCMRVV